MKYFFTLIIFLFSIDSFADTLSVKQDSTGDYTIIQDAIIASADGDIVLVWPGIYYENVDFAGKSIVLASLVLTTGDISYRYNTIIDGDSTGSCVKVILGENVSLNGFTLQNGRGTDYANPNSYYGGGILVIESSCELSNCIIKNNFSNAAGGGICFWEGYLSLSKTSIYNNYTYGAGGGIAIGEEGIVEFDSLELCNLYSNYSGFGCDLYKYSEFPISVYLDTSTILHPDRYFFISVDDDPYHLDDISYNILNSIISPVDSDLYVNPQSGDNCNSGLSPEEALKTISYAYSLIYPDSLNKNTIHLSNGIYSDSANNEKFPLNIRAYVNVEGESMDNTILDGMHLSPLIKGNRQVPNYSFKNMTMYRGGRVYPNTVFHVKAGIAKLHAQNDNVVLDSIAFINGHEYANKGGAFNLQASNNVLVSNCEFRNNLGGKAFRMGADTGDTTTISNCKFIDNMPDYEQYDRGGGSLSIFGYNTATIVTGCLFSGNDEWNLATLGAYDTINTSNYFVNCTFTANTLLKNNVSLAFIDASTFMYNCIVYNEGAEKPISVVWSEVTDTLSLNIYNSLIENGEESIYLKHGLTSLYYDETNIEGDPLFYGGYEYPFNLSDNSPCIDAGTLDLPEWIELPEYDLAGNLRVYNGAIDIGAYEWNPTVSIKENKSVIEVKEKFLNAMPNPFSDNTSISVIYKTKANYKLEIYNNYGQRVRVFFDGNTLPGTSQIKWNGTDDNRQNLSNGVYYVVLTKEGKEIETLKVIKIK